MTLSEFRESEVFQNETTSSSDGVLIVDGNSAIKKIEEILGMTMDEACKFAGYERWIYHDEGCTCGCGNLIEFEYGDYITTENEYICDECANSQFESLIEEKFLNENSVAIPIWLRNDDKLEELGFVKQEKEYENGMYGTCDDPNEITKGIKEDFVFTVEGSNPFAVYFSLWIKKEEQDAESD